MRSDADLVLSGAEEVVLPKTARLNKLRWHCRRALLELDLVFKRYWERVGDSIDAEEASALRALLAEEDHDLWALVSGKVAPDDVDVVRDNLLAELRRP